MKKVPKRTISDSILRILYEDIKLEPGYCMCGDVCGGGHDDVGGQEDALKKIEQLLLDNGVNPTQIAK